MNLLISKEIILDYLLPQKRRIRENNTQNWIGLDYIACFLNFSEKSWRDSSSMTVKQASQKSRFIIFVLILEDHYSEEQEEKTKKRT